MKCPKCGSRRVAPILYGMPAFDEEMVRRLNEKQLYLGGCCISGRDPAYHCFACGKDVGAPPVLSSKRGLEDYRDIVTAVRFGYGGYFQGHRQIDIRKTNGKITMEVSCFSDDPALPPARQCEITGDEWDRLMEKLYCRLYLHEWKKDYTDADVLDGEQWELDIRLTGGRARHYHGSNAYPPYWKELKTTFGHFFRKAGTAE